MEAFQVSNDSIESLNTFFSDTWQPCFSTWDWRIDATLKNCGQQAWIKSRQADKTSIISHRGFVFRTRIIRRRDPTINSPPSEIVTNTETRRSGWLCFR
jgi:hypothetical protein